MAEFSPIWNDLITRLKPGMEIRNWTVLKGYLGDTMTIEDVRRSSISVDAPGAEYIQEVPREDFESVWKLWQGYKDEKVRRIELRDITRYSKYIISILHWYESER